MPSPSDTIVDSPPKRRRRLLAIAEVTCLFIATSAQLMWCSVPNVSALRTAQPASTAFIDLRRDEAADAGKPFVLEWTWKPLHSISPLLRAAVVFAEDIHFYEHDGVDWDALEKAVIANWDEGHFAIGGSTITQQTAKNLFLSPSRSMLRKGREMLIAFRLEDSLSKERILEIYLNIVEWGDGVFGAEAASRHWFHHSAAALTAVQAARLAIALPNPRTRAPDQRSHELTEKAIRIVRLLRSHGLISRADRDAALNELGDAPTPTHASPASHPQ